MAVAELDIANLSEHAQRIVIEATRLFAEHGYEGVSTRQIANAVDLNIATVHHHVGTKHELYELCVERLFLQERAHVDAFAAEAARLSDHDAPALLSLMWGLCDAMVNVFAEDPMRARLHMQRWLWPEDSALRQRIEERTLAMYEPLLATLKRAQRAGIVRKEIDPPMFLRSFDWLLYGYFVSGCYDGRSLHADPMQAKHLKAFKRYLWDYLCCLLGLDEEEGGQIDAARRKPHRTRMGNGVH